MTAPELQALLLALREKGATKISIEIFANVGDPRAPALLVEFGPQPELKPATLATREPATEPSAEEVERADDGLLYASVP
jgi:hypothetical protein